jgi:putative Holliday junction resolvase
VRTLAIDFGSRRIGLALSDAAGRLATPYEVIEAALIQLAIERILAVIREEGVEQMVVGLPLNMDDSIGPSARSVMEFAGELRRRTGKPVLFVDERLSSFEAERQLDLRKRQGEKLTRKRRRRQLDAVAAAGFLQAFLDGRLPALDMDLS